MLSDRLGAPRVEVTHELAGIALGVRRASITVALQRLADQGLVASNRGTVELLDREALIKTSRGCYGPVEAKWQELTS